MLSGPLNFLAAPAGTTFAEPVPYGLANNLNDQGWIWPRDNTGWLAVDFGTPMVLSRLRVFCTYNDASRGATWTIEFSSDHTTWTPAANFNFVSTFRGGVDDSGAAVNGYGGWYETSFNATGSEARHWRIRQSAVLVDHAPRCGQMEFYGSPGTGPIPVTLKTAAPQGGGVRTEATLVLELEDGSPSQVGPETIQLTLDGQTVLPDLAKPVGGTVTTVTYDPPGRLAVGPHSYQIVFGDNTAAPALQTNSFSFVVVPDEFLQITPGMLSGNFTFYVSPPITNFATPLPYGVANNASDLGWIWVNDSYLTIHFGTPVALARLRGYASYPPEGRGAIWAIEVSNDGAEFQPVSEFTFQTSVGGGVNDDGTVRSDCAGWYETSFNQDGAKTGQYWRVRQIGVTIQHAPRVAQLEFYSPAPVPTLRSASPMGFTVPAASALSAQLQDNLTAVDLSSVRLFLDGQAVAATLDRPTGSFLTTVSYDPPGDLSWGMHAVRLVFGNNATPSVLQTNDWSFRVAIAPLPVCASMLSGPLNFVATPAGTSFNEPVPYGFVNNVNDQGWIWPSDNSGLLGVDFAVPTLVNGFRVYVTYVDAPRGANWAIEYSNDQATWSLATDFRFVSRPGGGLNDDFTVRADCGGWYEVRFNARGGVAARYWRVRQTEVLATHAPRCGQVEFYGAPLPPLPVTPAMLSGPLNFFATPAGGSFTEPIPYGYANNVADNGWIWPRDNSGLLQLDFGAPQVLNVVRVYCSYATEGRGALWAIERSDDATTWVPTADFAFESRLGVGVNDHGCKRADYGGWYGILFNASRQTARYWRVRQVQETVGHAPRCAQMQFFEIPAPPAPLRIEYAQEDGFLFLSWADPTDTAVLQWAETVRGPWQDVPGGFSPYPVSPTESAGFYRLRQ